MLLKDPVVFYLELTRRLFHSPPALFVICAHADCSLGEVNQSLEDSEELRAGGLYLMPETVACNGDIVLVETCFLKPTNGDNSVQTESGSVQREE